MFIDMNYFINPFMRMQQYFFLRTCEKKYVHTYMQFFLALVVYAVFGTSTLARYFFQNQPPPPSNGPLLISWYFSLISQGMNLFPCTITLFQIKSFETLKIFEFPLKRISCINNILIINNPQVEPQINELSNFLLLKYS